MGVEALRFREPRRVFRYPGVLITAQAGINIEIGNDRLDPLNALNGCQQSGSICTELPPVLLQAGESVDKPVAICLPSVRVRIHVGQIPLVRRVNISALWHVGASTLLWQKEEEAIVSESSVVEGVIMCAFLDSSR